MNGLLDSQTSGNDWTKPTPEFLHQVFQGATPVSTAKIHIPLVEPLGLRLQEHLEQEMARFEADHQTVISQLQKSYVLSNDRSVKAFLKSHRTIPHLLIQALPHLKQYFGASTVFTLRAIADEDGPQTLYAVVMWPGHVNDVRNALQNFDERWWIASSRQASGNLTFTYELV
jgi:hypothetical protein